MKEVKSITKAILVIYLLTKAWTVCFGYKTRCMGSCCKVSEKVKELGKKQFDDFAEKRLQQKTGPTL